MNYLMLLKMSFDMIKIKMESSPINNLYFFGLLTDEFLFGAAFWGDGHSKTSQEELLCTGQKTYDG